MLNLYVYVTASVLLAAAWVVKKVLDHRIPNLPFPVVGKSGDSDLSKAVIEGYRKYPDEPFILPTSPPQVFLPMSLFAETIHAPSEQISFSKFVYDLFLGGHTGVGEDNPHVINAVRRDLTKNIAGVLPLVQEEAEYAFGREIGDAADWTPIHLYSKLLRMVAYLSGRVFVGLPLSREEEWLDLTINYTVHMGEVMREGQSWHYLLRPLVAPFLPSVRRVNADVKAARQYMKPLVAEIVGKHERREDAAAAAAADPEKTANANTKAGSRGTFISWLLQYLPTNLRTADRIGFDQMIVSFASIHTTTMTSMMVLLDLAARPDCVRELRAEVAEVLRSPDGEAVDGNGRRYIPKASFARLRKLDSFVKESQRLSPLGFATSTRVLLAPYTFSSGLALPKGTVVSFPMWGIYHSADVKTFSPEYNRAAGNRGPEEFDAFRFARLREQAGNDSKHQAVTTGTDSLNFGHGPHACPGRFFAVYEIKTLVIEFIRHFDIRLKGDTEAAGGEHIRPKNTAIKLGNNPDFAAFLEVKRRDPHAL